MWRGGERPKVRILQREGTGIPLSDHRAGGVRWGTWGNRWKADSLGRAEAATREFRWTVILRRSLAGPVRWSPKARFPSPRPFEIRGDLTWVPHARNSNPGERAQRPGIWAERVSSVPLRLPSAAAGSLSPATVNSAVLQPRYSNKNVLFRKCTRMIHYEARPDSPSESFLHALHRIFPSLTLHCTVTHFSRNNAFRSRRTLTKQTKPVPLWLPP